MVLSGGIAVNPRCPQYWRPEGTPSSVGDLATFDLNVLSAIFLVPIHGNFKFLPTPTPFTAHLAPALINLLIMILHCFI